MKKSISLVFFSLTLLIVMLSCSLFSIPASPTSIPSPVPPTDTPLPIPPTFAPEPTTTDTPIPSPTLAVMAVPTIIVLPQQWNGTFTYTNSIGAKQPISMLIEKIDGTTFTGKMIWHAFSKFRGAILKMHGEFVTDFGDEIEQIKWNNLDDYKSEDKSGYWLKWTETEIIDGANYTVNGWYYAHIRESGTMVAVYFFNDKETVADSGVITLEQVTP
jgi:hypothetical protein